VLALPTSAAAFVPRSYTILSAAGGVSGTFSGIDRSLIPAAFGVSLSYTATEVMMSLSSALSQLSGLNRNQRAVAFGLDTGLNAIGAPNSGFVTLLNLPGAALPGALTQLSGEVATGAQTAGFQIMNQYLALLLNPVAEGRGGGAFGPAAGFASAAALPRDVEQAYAAAMPVKAAPAAAAPSGWSVWGAAYGGSNRTDGEGVVIGSHDIRPRAYGFAGGADYRPAPGTLLGFSLAGGGTSWSLNGNLGSGRSDVFQTGGYASQQFGAAYLSGALAYAWHDGSIDRTVTVAGIDTLHGDFRADSVGARLEGGYRFAMGGAGLTPYGALQGQSFRTAGFGETAAAGSAQFALNYGSQTSHALRAELGAWADGRLALAGGHALALRGRLAWAHDDVSGARIGAAFLALPGSGFTVLGAEAPSDLALVSAGAELRLRNGLSLGAKFDGEFAGGSQTYGGAGTIRYTW
jgi:outer membrane autotransporter protein